MTEFKIKFPDNQSREDDKIEKENKIKSVLKNTADGILSKLLVFNYTYKVCSTAEMVDLLSDFYHIPYDKSNLSRYNNILFSLGLLGKHESFYASIHNSDPILKMIREKHQEWLMKIPTQFHKKFSNVNYYYITEYGKTFIPWATEVLGFNCETEGEKNEI